MKLSVAPAALAVSVVALAASSASAQVLFGPAQTSLLASGETLLSNGLAAGDFNGDGFDDLVLARAAGVSLCLADGAGHFGAPAVVSPDITGRSVATGDIDGDGFLDVLSASGGSTGRLFVLHGLGDGNFGEHESYPIGFMTTGTNEHIDVADADEDGDLDVLVAKPPFTFLLAGGFDRFLNDGTGALVADDVITLAGGGAYSGFLADFNGDGLIDVVQNLKQGSTTFTYSCKLVFDNGAGSYSLGPAFADETALGVADVDGDGELDLVTNAASGVRARLGAGDGSFGAPLPTNLPASSTGVRLSDFDGDGAPDLLGRQIVAPPDVHVLRGAGGTFGGAPVSGAPVSVTLASGSVADPVVVGDFDGDGRPDVGALIGNGGAAPLLSATLNETYAAGGPLLDLGNALRGGAGFPIQIAAGTFVAGSPFSFQLWNAPSSGQVFLVIGVAQLEAPFKGGIMVPVPFLITGPFPTTPAGTLVLAGTWPSGAPSGVPLVAQFWFADPAGPVGFAASSGVRVTTP